MDDIQEEIKHLKSIIAALHKQRRVLDKQVIDFGELHAPTHKVNELAAITQQISTRTEELEHLESLAVEDKRPLSEVEYRMILAQVWDNERGYPSVSQQTKLEYERLRLHIPPHRAKELEKEIRSELSSEWIHFFYTQTVSSKMFGELIRWISNQKPYREKSFMYSEDLSGLKKLVALDIDHALTIILEESHSSIPYDMNRLHTFLISASPTKDHSEAVREALFQLSPAFQNEVEQVEEAIRKVQDRLLQ